MTTPTSASAQNTLEYDYYEADGAYRPIIPIEIGYGKERLYYTALVDSGADFCLFDCEMAEALGIQDLTSGEPVNIQGLNNEAVCGYEHDVTFYLEDIEFAVTAVFAECVLPSEYGVLGQRGFFSKFIVAMDYANKKVRLIAQAFN